MRCLLLLLCFLWGMALPAQLPKDPISTPELAAWLMRNYTANQHLDSILAVEDVIRRRAATANNNRQSAQLLRYLAGIKQNSQLGGGDEALLQLYYEALNYAERSGHQPQITELYMDMASTLQDVGRPREGEELLFKALDIHRANDDSLRMMTVYRELCDVCRGVGEYREALQYADFVRAYFGRHGDPRLRDNAGLCALITHQEMGAPAQTLALAERMLAERAANPEVQYYNLHFILTMQRNALLDLDRPAEAIPISARLVGELEKYGPGAALYYYAELGKWRYLQGRYAEAAAAYDSFFALAQQEKPSPYVRDYLADRLANDRARGDTESALATQTALLVVKDSLSRIELAGLRSELRHEFAAEQREAVIEQQRAQLTQKTKNQYLTYGILALLLLGIGGLVYGRLINRRKNRLLEKRNTENELLLREIHHRVKNNLEVVSSLLELQSAQLTDENAQEAMRAGQSRVASMGLLHKRLYQGTHLASVDLPDYLRNLADALRETYEADAVRIEVDVPPLALDVDRAVPLGLIVNELLTNAIKYAFDERGGHIKVSLQREAAANTYRLTVADDGRGKVAGTTPTGTGFGSQLVKLLARQLNAQLSEVSRAGLRTELVFSL